jgi:hypothetical protein
MTIAFIFGAPVIDRPQQKRFEKVFNEMAETQPEEMVQIGRWN